MLAGIVCEYNPFHNGHLYQLEKTKQAGADAIVCVMSGNFVQRGECAFLDKWKRAEAAVRCGANVVIDLPVPWALSSAEDFARGSIELLRQFGVELVSFGSETDDKNKLLEALESTFDERVRALIREYMSKGMSYPLSLSTAVKSLYSQELAEVLSSPNSTLAVEYLRQIKNLGGMDFLPVKRKGASHDSDSTTDEGFSCASKIRRDVKNNRESFCEMPFFSADILKKSISEKTAPCLMSNNERAVLSSLRELDVGQLKKHVGDESGLVARIYDSLRSATTLDELYDNTKSKNYTHSRIRREILCTYLRIEKELSKGTPPYMRILAVDEKGLSLLSSAKKNSAIPIVTRHSEMQNLCEKSKRIYELQCSCTDKFALFSPRVRECGLEQKNSMLIIK